MTIRYRIARITPETLPLLFQSLKNLAADLNDDFTTRETELHAALFGPSPTCNALLALQDAHPGPKVRRLDVRQSEGAPAFMSPISGSLRRHAAKPSAQPCSPPSPDVAAVTGTPVL